jgi:hypothetical protein
METAIPLIRNCNQNEDAAGQSASNDADMRNSEQAYRIPQIDFGLSSTLTLPLTILSRRLRLAALQVWLRTVTVQLAQLPHSFWSMESTGHPTACCGLGVYAGLYRNPRFKEPLPDHASNLSATPSNFPFPAILVC